MSSRQTAIWAGGIGLILSWVVVGCEGKSSKKEEPDIQKVTLMQGNTSAAIVLGGSGQAKVEGEKDGVTASIEQNGSIFVSAAKDAKVGAVELIIKDNAGKKVASLMVTVQEPETDLKFHLLGRKRATAWQNDETEIRTSVIRRSEYTLGSNDASTDLAVTGKFQGDLKLSAEVVKGGKGITVRFDPATVKGSEQTSQLKIKAAENADLGEVVVKLTATTSEGKTTSASVLLDVDVAVKKK